MHPRNTYSERDVNFQIKKFNYSIFSLADVDKKKLKRALFQKKYPDTKNEN